MVLIKLSCGTTSLLNSLTCKHKKKIEHKFDLSEIEEDDKDSSLKKFEFLGVAGEGAFGKVYKAKYNKSQEECAIKAMIYKFSNVINDFLDHIKSPGQRTKNRYVKTRSVYIIKFRSS